MATTTLQAEALERAEQHASEAERLLESRFLSSHVKAQAHATLAVYYAARHGEQAASAPGSRADR